MKKRLISAIMASAITATTLSPVFAEDNTISMSYSNGQLMINSSQLSKGTLIYSEYENGRLTNVKLYKDISFEKNTFTIEAEEGDKFILVDSIDKMQPLCDSITVSKDVPTPTNEPTNVPTEIPTETPTEEPTLEPTATVIPTDSPTATPTATPVPTYTPSPSPTVTPTEEPTKEPTSTPTEVPTETPTEEPTATPSPTPTAAPTEEPTTTLERYITFAGDETTYYNIKVAIDVTTVSNTPKKVIAIDDMPEGYKVTGVLLSDNKLMVSVMKDDVLVAIVEATEEPIATPEPTFTPTPEPTDAPTEEPTKEPTATPTLEPTDAPTEEPIETPEPETMEVGISYYDVDNEWAEWEILYMPVIDGQVTFTSDFIDELVKEHEGYEFKCIYSGLDEDNKIIELPVSFEEDEYGITVYIEYQKKATPTPEPTATPTPSPTPTAEPTATPSPTPTAKPTM